LQIVLSKNFKIISLKPDHKLFLIRFFILLLLVIWMAGFLLPLITSIENPFINYVIKRLYSTTCHQESFKCISIGNDKMLVCARCAGIYFGALISAIFGLFIIPLFVSKKLLLISIVPLLLDVLLTSSGVYSYSQFLSFATGIIFGIAIYLFTFEELKNLFLTNNRKYRE
jgi:uncharacterized membrane protein